MKKYYSVDSTNGLFPSCLVSLGDYVPKPPELAVFLNQIHPEGLSKHGYNYLYNPGPIMEDASDESRALLVGLIFELVRRSYFPEKPSRYQSLFACQHIDEVKQFAEKLANEKNNEAIKKAAIYEVLTDKKVHRGDMNLLDSQCTILELYHRAYTYWSGETYPLNEKYEPFWEILIPLPVLIGQRIAD